MDILAAIIVFACALVARLVVYSFVFSRKATGQVAGVAFIMYLAVTFVAGIFFTLLLFFMIQDGIPAEIRTPPFFIGISAIIEPALAYGTSQLAASLSQQQDRASEKHPSRYTCDDGHVVKSRAETLIDNWLCKEGIVHEYEPSLTIAGSKIKPDWYLPDGDVYVEFWGFLARDNKAYNDRRNHKEKLYASANKRLVGITSGDLEDINVKVKQKLLNFLDESEFSRPKRCFNCGVALDDRYK
ncbi:MAG: dicarboxylate/amino acid:cation symporter [Candidatus Lokiarchaeota archaeon]|nr:dicarboxylate/amino acid:cation symporter [Candidatus Lokiarchaeota archaeon]